MTHKPMLPEGPFDSFLRVTVDTSTGSAFTDAHRIATRAATGWMRGPDGPYKKQLAMAEVVDGAVREALLHLLELGFIDIDEERMRSARGWPMGRSDTKEA
ncbi:MULTISPECIES: hypothetical protein [Streptomyces]|uniref:hypothetical protein n=1 Tax=Streptomyces TaxID=1883 RepID=UPI0004CD8AA2|nr:MULTISPECIES: hypothetical protein [Streptomyces]KOT57073.1 hypothetical protein ADK43_21820 [Streptomyces rimosus subsp. rimosus]